MTDLLDEPGEPAHFTALSSARMVKAGEELLAALQSYITAAADVTDEAGADALEESGTTVAMAGARFDDAHYDHLGHFAPVGDIDLLDDEDEEDDEDDLDEAIAAGRAVSVVSRQDFVLNDGEAVWAAAREAWSRCHGQLAEKANISSAGQALYELIHDRGRDSLSGLPGLTPLASMTVFRQPKTPLHGSRIDQVDSEMEDGYPSLFEPDGEVMYSFGERWG